jgi:ubiquinone biosynthesis accessory factor UbiJ
MLLATLENVLNRGLPRSQRARELTAQLAGRSVAIEVRDLVTLRVAANGQTLSVHRGADGADARISGGPLGLLGLAGAAPQAVVQRGAVSIEGDAEVAQKFRELAQLLRPDLEEELALLIGDVPAHQLGRLARAGADFSRRAAGTTLQNFAEFLAHERADLVSRNEGEQFLRGVDQLRESFDRLEARFELLMRRRGAS